MYSSTFRCVVVGTMIGLLILIFTKWNSSLDLELIKKQVKEKLADPNWAINFVPPLNQQAKELMPDSDLSKNQAPAAADKPNITMETARGNTTYDELDKEVFNPLGYFIRNSSFIPALDFMEPLNCPKVFFDWLQISNSHNKSATPPKEIPTNQTEAYTLNGYVSLVKEYKDEHLGVKKAVWTKQIIDTAVKREPTDKPQGYTEDGVAIYQAMKAFNVSGKRGAVVGSQTPWIEGFALKLGAKHMTTMDYMKIEIRGDDRINAINPVAVAKDASRYIGKNDFIASFSSIEHSGLGRYGDALDPIGDLREAMKLHCLLKKHGFLFIGFPFGWDTLQWNSQRIYGRIRFALFAAGFDILALYDSHGSQPIDEQLFKRSDKPGNFKQLVVVLRKRS